MCRGDRTWGIVSVLWWVGGTENGYMGCMNGDRAGFVMKYSVSTHACIAHPNH